MLRFNADGPDGLTNRGGAGRPRLLNEKQMQELAQIVETGPDRETDGPSRRCFASPAGQRLFAGGGLTLFM